jgi:uncharacterized protein
MKIKIAFSDDPSLVLNNAGEFLAGQPVFHNLILTLLHARVAYREPGRYWMAIDGDEVVGVVVQSPLTFPVTVTPMDPAVVNAMVDAIAELVGSLPGVSGHAATAASFAGQWTERCRSAATPIQGHRLYELSDLGEAPNLGGKLRQVTPSDRSLMIQWTRAFQEEIGQPAKDIEIRVDRGLSGGQLWGWDKDGELLSMAVAREPAIGVVRLSGVYTPPQRRNQGFASACVHALSKRLRASGYRCILYTDLANPSSNSIYRRIGYRAALEVLRYRFE